MATIKNAPNGEKTTLTGNELVPISNFPDNPALPDQYSKLSTVLSYIRAQSLTPYIYSFSTDTTDSDPTNGIFKLDNADPTLATFIYISYNNAQGQDISEILLDLVLDFNITMQDVNNPAKAFLYDVSGDPIDATTYVKIPVTFASQSGGGAFANAATVSFVFLGAGQSLVGADEPERIDFDPNLTNIYKTRYVAPVQLTDITSTAITNVVYSAAPDDGNYDFAGNIENNTLANLNTYLNGITDGVWTEVWTIVTATRPCSIKRIVNIQ